MRSRSLDWKISVFVLTAALGCQATLERSPEGWLRPLAAHSLFNGVDLAGWSTWLGDTQRADPRNVYTVTDGAIRISGDGFGYLATTERYSDYRLLVEFRWGERNFQARVGKARDSGVFLHSVGPDGNSYDGNGAFRAAIECQVMEGAVGDFLLIKGKYEDGTNVPVRFTTSSSRKDRDGWPWWDPDGQDLTLEGTGRINWLRKSPDWQDRWEFRGENDLESPAKEWNRLECVCRGDSIRIWLNGVLVNEARSVFPTRRSDSAAMRRLRDLLSSRRAPSPACARADFQSSGS